MIRLQSHLLSASMCSSMTACAVSCFLSGGSLRSSVNAIDDLDSAIIKSNRMQLQLMFVN